MMFTTQDLATTYDSRDDLRVVVVDSRGSEVDVTEVEVSGTRLVLYTEESLTDLHDK